MGSIITPRQTEPQSKDTLNKEHIMSIATLILGESGSGKTTSLRNLDPAHTLLIQAQSKPLPFKSKEWVKRTKDANGKAIGNIFVSDRADQILTVMHRSTFPVIVLDDFQYVMSNEFMRRSMEKGFDKFTEIGRNAWDILTLAGNLAPETRVYILSHTQTDDSGRTKIKTIGKMLDEKITLEGMFTTVLRTVCADGSHYFSTQNNGNDTVKSPMGMFDSQLIDNDLVDVDCAICEFYGLSAVTA